MKNHLKLLYSISLILLFNKGIFSQLDSIRSNSKKNKSIFISSSIGLPLYNQILLCDANNRSLQNKVYSKSKFLFNINLDFNKRHFTFNSFVNYLQNEFNGNSYIIEGYQTQGHPLPTVYKHFDVYQHVKYNYIQIGLGCGYNKSFKKNNFALTTNAMYNAYSDIHYSTFFSANSSQNNNDTLKINLKKDLKLGFDNVWFAFYLNFKITYSYMLNKRISFCSTLNASYGILDIYSSNGYSSQDLRYNIKGQKIIFTTVGIKYKLK